MEPESFLGQILVDGTWLDYARGSEEDSRRWQQGDPTRRRVVDWIYTDRVIIPASTATTKEQ